MTTDLTARRAPADRDIARRRAARRFTPDAWHADTGAVTTFDDTDLFDTVDESDGAPGRVRRGRVVVVLVVAAALVVSGVAWLLLARGSQPTADGMSVALLARPVQATDAIAPAVVDETGIDPTTSRFAVRTGEGQHYAALRWSGHLCLVVVPTGDAARIACVAPSATASVTLSGDDGSRVRLVADDARAPDVADGWRPAGTNVWVLDAPAAEANPDA